MRHRRSLLISLALLTSMAGSIAGESVIARSLPRKSASSDCACTTCDGAQACRYKKGSYCGLNGTSCVTYGCSGTACGLPQ